MAPASPHTRYGNATGPRFRGRGEWPFMTFADDGDPGGAEACRVSQRLAMLLLESMAADGCSMRQLARDSGVDVTTVKSVLEGSYGPRLDTVVRLMLARGLPLALLLSDVLRARGLTSVEGERRTITLPEPRSSSRQTRSEGPANE